MALSTLQAIAIRLEAIANRLAFTAVAADNSAAFLSIIGSKKISPVHKPLPGVCSSPKKHTQKSMCPKPKQEITRLIQIRHVICPPFPLGDPERIAPGQLHTAELLLVRPFSGGLRAQQDTEACELHHHLKVTIKCQRAPRKPEHAT